MAASRRRISASAVRPARSTPLSRSWSSDAAGELVPDGADLEHHDADGVGDDVVELAGDPRTLLRHRDARRLALALGVRRALFRRFGLLGTLTQRVARDPGDHEPEGNEDEVAGRVARGCCRRRSRFRRAR